MPSAPLNLFATDVTMDAVTLNWTKPRSDGGLPVKHYVIERKEPTLSYWSNVGRVDSARLSHTVRNLQPGTEYYFR